MHPICPSALGLSLAMLLAGCELATREQQAARYTLTPSSNGSEILLDQVTGDTWRLLDGGWVPIRRLTLSRSNTPPPHNLADIDIEIARRNAIYELLAKSSEAQHIAQQLKIGALSADQARAKLQALVPPSLGALPPETESSGWQPIGK